MVTLLSQIGHILYNHIKDSRTIISYYISIVYNIHSL